MSDAVPYLITAATIGIALTLGPWAAAAFSVAAGAAYGDYSRRKAKQEANKAYNDSLTDRTMTVRSATSPRKLALGRVRLGGVLLYADTVGTNQTQFDQVLALCDGPIRRVRGLYLGDTYYAADQFDSAGRILSGQYSSQRQVNRYDDNFVVGSTAKSTFTLSRDPLLTLDGVSLPVTVAWQQAGRDANKNWTSVTYTLSGRLVTLAAPLSNVNVRVGYSAVAAEPVLAAQWTLGAQTTALSWSGVSTPNWPSTAVCNGVAVVRALMTWDETAYQAGAPEINAVVDGVCDVYDPRKNLAANPVWAGAVAGTPGTVPPGVSIGSGSGINWQITGSGCDSSVNLPYIDVRFYGTASATNLTAAVVQFCAISAAPTASVGQNWCAKANIKCLSFNNAPTGYILQILSISSGLINNEGYGAEIFDASGKTVSLQFSKTLVASGISAATARIGIGVSSGISYDCSFRIFMPFFWRGYQSDDLTAPVGYTNNPALLAAYLHVRPRNRMGCGTPWTMIDWSSVAAAANICDEQITVKKLDDSGYEQINRYSCNTVLSAENSPADNIATIVSAMAGDCVFTAGLYRIYAGAYRAPTRTLTDDDVLAGHGLTIYPNITGLDAIPNGMTGTFADAAADYVQTSAPAVVNDSYVSSDGAAEDGDLTLHATTDARQANYLMRIALEQARPAFGAEITVGASAADIALVDTLSLDLSGYEAFDSVVWEVRRRVNNFDGSYALVLRQTKSNIWALDAEKYTPVTQLNRPDTSFLWTVAPVSSLAVSLPAIESDAGGAGNVRFGVSWLLHSQPYVRGTGKIEIRWRDYGATDWAGATSVDGAQTSAFFVVPTAEDVRWEVQARAVNGVGGASPWSSAVADATLINYGLITNKLGILSSYSAKTTGSAIARLGVDISWIVLTANELWVNSTKNVAWRQGVIPAGVNWYVRLTPWSGGTLGGSATSVWLPLTLALPREWTLTQDVTGSSAVQAELAWSTDGVGVAGAVLVSLRASVSGSV